MRSKTISNVLFFIIMFSMQFSYAAEKKQYWFSESYTAKSNDVMFAYNVNNTEPLDVIGIGSVHSVDNNGKYQVQITVKKKENLNEQVRFEEWVEGESFFKFIDTKGIEHLVDIESIDVSGSNLSSNGVLLSDSCVITITGQERENIVVPDSMIAIYSIKIPYLYGEQDSKEIALQCRNPQEVFRVLFKESDSEGKYELVITNPSAIETLHIVNVSSSGCFKVQGLVEFDINPNSSEKLTSLVSDYNSFVDDKCFDHITIKYKRNDKIEAVNIPVSMFYQPSWLWENKRTIAIVGVTVVVGGVTVYLLAPYLWGGAVIVERVVEHTFLDGWELREQGNGNYRFFHGGSPSSARAYNEALASAFH